MRVAIYARYSSDNQRDASIEDQIRVCRDHAQRQGWQIVETFADHSISGSSFLRPQYQRLLELARVGKFDIVLAEAMDRLSRDQEHIAAFYKQLTFAGVQLITLSEGIINELHVGLKGTMNALFLKDLADKTRRGMRGRVEKGQSGGGLCYGYDVVRKFNAEGEAIRGERRINPEQSAILCRIFKEFAAGRSARAIATDLNQENIPGPQGGKWGQSTINGNKTRGTGILNNELYVGRMVWNRLRYIKDPTTGKRVSRENPVKNIIITEVPELRIIDQALWDTVRARKEEMSRATRPDKPFQVFKRPQHLLSGLMKCGVCGSNYVKIGVEHFGCAASRDKGKSVCANRRSVKGEYVENRVLAGLRHQLMDPEIFGEFVKEFHAAVNRGRMENNANKANHRDELIKIEKRINKTKDILLESDDVDPKALIKELLALEARQEELTKLLEVEPADSLPLIHPGLADLYQRKITALHAAMADGADKYETFDLIRSLISEIRLVPDGKEFKIDLKGNLAGILALCQAGKTKKNQEVSAEFQAYQIQLVAGARFELTTFRL